MPKVLIVDDIRSEVQLIADALTPKGYDCIQASNGLEAVERARTELPDLILLDVVMPGQDGFATCRQLKRDVTTKEIPVVIVSSKNGESDRFWGQKQGASDYLTKPFSPDDLVTMVRRFV
ncbi:MAG: response regulator [Deltaproteobacteria bacterium]|nr:response regulator [Deltaproteobacteria bacterium]MBI3387566.1 response regulator [Deltaproteobacteria bacterium]